nr:hypothetical protein [Amycolatopsis alkalitolerans]
MQTPDVTESLLDGVLEEIRDLRDVLAGAEAVWAERIGQVDRQHRVSAINLAHYWAVRQYDLRSLQARLAALGLSSLGRSEAHVQPSLEAIEAAATALARRPAAHGAFPPAEAATDPGLVRSLVAHGMDLARINCAHDDPGVWGRMVDHVRHASGSAASWSTPVRTASRCGSLRRSPVAASCVRAGASTCRTPRSPGARSPRTASTSSSCTNTPTSSNCRSSAGRRTSTTCTAHWPDGATAGSA